MSDKADIPEVIWFAPSKGSAIKLKCVPSICSDSLRSCLKAVNVSKYVAAAT